MVIPAIALLTAGLGALHGASRSLAAGRKAPFFAFAYLAAALFLASIIVVLL